MPFTSTANDLAPPPLDLRDNIVTVHIKTGEVTRDTYQIHKKLIESTSTYFKSVFNNGFLESATQAVTLADEEDIIGFPVLSTWLYTGNFDANIRNDDRLVEPTLMKLCEIFVFADK
ncbi:MAG: hypothetical protein M1821_001912 [Bathelium mastoideum]|nr:MAG: hypothetical protein M1821_001912 [Bathelium mastoideum]KAI9692422.1 MAG: hypothetical protein M1822_006653 [Bathelium mastoideum]